MRDSLQIGEIARLLGVTPKTIRHYHKLGLVAEPSRSEGGYRLYGARHLLRLRQIRTLQRYGLSLARIGELMHAPDQEASLWEQLHARRDDLVAQIADLQRQLARIEQIVADEPPDLLAHLDGDSSPTVAALYDELTPLLPPTLDPAHLAALRTLDEKLFAHMEGFAWPADGPSPGDITAFFTDHPDLYQRLVVLALRLLDLSTEPDRVDEARAIAAELRTLTQQMPQGGSALPTPFATVFRDLMLDALTPAQRHLLESLMDSG